MNSAAFKPPTLALFKPPISSSIIPSHKPKRYSSFTSLKLSRLISTHPQPPPPDFDIVGEKINILVSEFKSLSEPIDRVKRLIHYASLLPEFEDSGRVESNKVTGCTAQVWLEVIMDTEGVMNFRVDSDSEITKGFCYCLIWLLDGARAADVLKVKIDDLGDINIGVFPVRATSRVNTWHNVLISMQTRTQALIMERYGDPSLPLLSFNSICAEEIAVKLDINC